MRKTTYWMGMMALLLAVVLLAGCGAQQQTEAQAENPRYDEALALLEAGEFKEAVEAFTELGDYKDSREKVLTALHDRAAEMMEQGTSDPAAAVLLKLLSTSKDMGLLEQETMEQVFGFAKEMLEGEKFSPAKKLFDALGEFEDSAEFSRYADAYMALKRGAYKEALEGFRALGEFLDSQELIPGIEQTMEEKGIH